ncbi:Velvet factor [Penicillium chermesinum]|nr:Velvet factor [Penicillium chermesinum]
MPFPAREAFPWSVKYSSISPTVTSNTAHLERSPGSIASAQNTVTTPQTPQKPQSRNPSYSIPHGFDNLLHHEPESFPSPEPKSPSTSSTTSPPPPPIPSKERFYLHVRQQRTGARACGAGDRDRRPVDPPPIVQILLRDFDPRSKADVEILRDPRFTVGCLLFPVPDTPDTWNLPPNPEQIEREERERRERQDAKDKDDPSFVPLLSGKAFMSPFYVDADPDPNSAPTHPSFSPAAPALPPPPTCAFRLMNWGAVEDTGMAMPILAEAWSDPFRVYPAKDFPGMRDSSILAEGLKELGFVELKTRGKHKGKGRKKS